MSKNAYTLRYGPPLTVRDEPHRTLDTLSIDEEPIEITSDDFSAITVIDAHDEGTEVLEIRPSEADELRTPPMLQP